MVVTEHKLSPSITKLQRGLVLRANSLLITVYGDAISSTDQFVWLGSLIQLADLFGLSSRLVRTSAFRLSADDWLRCTRMGRRSFYGLTVAGLQRVQHAERRIYDFELPNWDGRWTLALLASSMAASVRLHVKRELRWEGFGELSPNVFAHPHVNHTTLQEIIRSAAAVDEIVVLSAESIAAYSSKPLQTVMHSVFKLDQVETAFKQFVVRFEPVLQQAAGLSPAEAFFVRTLLIHEYRKVLLRDPNLPQALLPADWSGLRARQLCEALYSQLLSSSEAFLQARVETLDGSFNKAARKMRTRLTNNDDKK
ncbi:MAG: phenylacetic acid degradation operon negative regulatory protein PaaX [Polaromonas sp.]|nr:phenylacetic acid degradation operon negative regulatory protein PaaX [Polaromonas sp.]